MARAIGRAHVVQIVCVMAMADLEYVQVSNVAGGGELSLCFAFSLLLETHTALIGVALPAAISATPSGGVGGGAVSSSGPPAAVRVPGGPLELEKDQSLSWGPYPLDDMLLAEVIRMAGGADLWALPGAGEDVIPEGRMARV